MDLYRYQARNAAGEAVQGQIEAASPQAVVEWLGARQLVPVRIERGKPAGAAPWWQTLGLAGKLGTDDLMLFTRQIGIMVKAGVPMLQSLASMQRSSSKPALLELLRALRDDLDRGLELSAAMARHSGFFDDYYVSMVRIGENAGQLDHVFERLYAQLEFEKDIRKKIKSALRYPTFVLSALVIAMGVLSIFVIPVFARVYEGMKVALPPLTRVLIGISNFAVDFWWVVVAVALVLGYLVRLVLATPVGRYTWDQRKLGLPVFGSILAKAAMARFCLSFATASRSGVPIDRVFNLVAQVVDNAYYARKIVTMREGIERGESVLRVAQASAIFQPMELQMIAIGEETGALEEMLQQVATIYQDEVEYEVGRLGESIEPILLVIIGGMVLVLVLGIFMPLWDLGQMAR